MSSSFRTRTPPDATAPSAKSSSPGGRRRRTQEHVERRLERARDLERDGHTAARQTDHADAEQAGVSVEVRREALAGVGAILEEGHARLLHPGKGSNVSAKTSGRERSIGLRSGLLA